MSTTTTTEVPTAHGVRPARSAPDLTVPLLRGGTYRLADRRPRTFTMVVFFRGLHCPVCRAQLSELEHRLDELEGRGIDVNAVAPGPTRTPGTQAMGEGLDQLAATLPLGRPASAEEIANAALFLGSDEASYINGAILAVDGGRSAT